MAVDNTKISALITALDGRYVNENTYTTDMAGKANAEHTHTTGDIKLDEGILGYNMLSGSNSLNIDTEDIENTQLNEVIASISYNIDNLWSDKVYAEQGKGLSSEDFTSALKTKLEGIESGANAYTHPNSTQSAVTSGLYKIATDAQGHITGATAVAKADITALGIPAQDTTYGNATTSTAGLMSAQDKTALDSLADAGAVTITKDTNVTGNVARYTISQGGNALATTIDIPTDMVVQSGQIVVNPTGQPAGTYIELTIANQSEPIYINVADLIDAYTGRANQIAVSASNEISIATGGVGLNELASAVSTQWTADADTEIEAYLDALTTALTPSS